MYQHVYKYNFSKKSSSYMYTMATCTSLVQLDPMNDESNLKAIPEL